MKAGTVFAVGEVAFYSSVALFMLDDSDSDRRVRTVAGGAPRKKSCDQFHWRRPFRILAPAEPLRVSHYVGNFRQIAPQFDFFFFFAKARGGGGGGGQRQLSPTTSAY